MKLKIYPKIVLILIFFVLYILPASRQGFTPFGYLNNLKNPVWSMTYFIFSE